MAYTRVHRLLKIVALVQSHRQWNAESLARECDTTVRTVYRDLQELEAAGIPVRFDKDAGGYRVMGSFFMPPVHLTGEEALALSALCEHIGQNEQIPLLKPAWRALHKVESQLPQSIQDELSHHAGAVAIQTAAAMPADGYKDVYDCVRDAIRHNRVLRCCYEAASSSSGDDETEFAFHPYTLLFSVRAWYALGWHTQREDLRCLKLSRFTKIEIAEDTYTVPETFTVSEYLGNAWRMIRDEADVDVELWFDAEFAPTVTDTRWHRTQDITWHDDQSCTFTCTVSGFSEIEWWILSMGPHCVVKEPHELAQRVRTLAQQTAAVYE